MMMNLSGREGMTREILNKLEDMIKLIILDSKPGDEDSIGYYLEIEQKKMEILELASKDGKKA